MLGTSRRVGAVLALLAASATASPEVVAVPPGTVVAWRAPGTTECRQGSRRFTPLDETCYFAIDLLATGEIGVGRTTAQGRDERLLRVGAYPYPEQRISGVDDKYVSPSPADLARIARENARIGKLWSLSTPRRFTLPLGAPLVPLPTGGRFGSRRIFNGEPRSPHGGSDFAAKSGTVVSAPAAGTVALAEEHFFAGRAVYLDHGDGLITMAFHLSRLLVRTGDTVERGQPIGEVGATGRVTGPHLHFAVRWRGARVDPAALLGDPAALRALTP